MGPVPTYTRDPKDDKAVPTQFLSRGDHTTLLLDSLGKSGYILAIMRHQIIFAPEAVQDLKRLSARNRSIVRDAIEKHLRHEPGRTSRSRIKRLRGIRRPEYRLRIGEIRVYYDIAGQDMEVLAIIPKSKAAEWLEGMGETE